MYSLAFELGFDHYRFQLPLDISRFADRHREEIRNGYAAAKYQQVSRKMPDMFEKKLLSIRDRALVKELDVTITARDLMREYEKTKGVCPVTDVPFTFAENADTDWSVDRIDNDRGYCPDNIVIVSVIVNRSKSDLDLSGLIKGALDDHSQDEEGLSGREWFRMAKFYFKKMPQTKPLNFCQLLSNTQRLFDQLVFLQLFHHTDPNSRRFLKQLGRYCNKVSIKKAEKLASKRVYHRADIAPEVLYDSPKLYAQVQFFIQVIRRHSQEFDGLLLNCLLA
ncbi:hypothetical protein [Methylomarinum vadi]|uniref:hypothetical protein n=1 Tax=Methylomarinum vadi TaxID=438855 RepID=UPI0004DF70A8|nr:hypothetical protein [Methylomarinum vadi]